MATRYPSDGPSASSSNSPRLEPGIRRTTPSTARRTAPAPRYGNTGAPRTSASRASAPRSSASRTGAPRYGNSGATRTSAPRSGAAPRRTAPAARRAPQRRKQGNPLPVIAALLVVAVILVLAIVKPFSRREADPVAVSANLTPTAEPIQTAAPAANDGGEQAPEQYDNLEDKLADADYDVGSLSAEEMAQVSDLSLNTSLPSEWLNVLLLGTDERTLSESARTDAMLICSINRNTGEVKLTSIMRDLAIEYTDIGKFNGTYRINAANYFGGPKLAMKTINEKFNMNIQYYVMVNFFGFQKIAQRLGGVDMNITKEEMDKINILIVQQAKAAYSEGIDESDQENVYLETYGPNTHLNGRQTLAYARIRKLSGGDAMRTERQRKVLSALLDKAKGLSAVELLALGSEMITQVKTNMEFDDMANIAMQVYANGIPSIKTETLPLSGTYRLETRNEQSMLYDCDFEQNALQLYNFIYEG